LGDWRHDLEAAGHALILTRKSKDQLAVEFVPHRAEATKSQREKFAQKVQNIWVA